MDQVPHESNLGEMQQNGLSSQANAQLGMAQAPASQVGSQCGQTSIVPNVQLVNQQAIQRQHVPIQSLQILPNAGLSANVSGVQGGTSTHVQQIASAGTVQQANVRQLLTRNTGQHIRLQQVAGGSNVIRLVNQGSQPTGQIMFQSATGSGNIRLAQVPQNQTFRLVNTNQQPRQTFVISQPVTQTTQSGVMQNNMGQIRIVNLGGNQLASLAGLQVRQPVQGQVRVAYTPSSVNAQVSSAMTSSASSALAQAATSLQQPVNIQVNSAQQPVNIQIANHPQNTAQVRLQSAQSSNVQLQNQQQIGLQTSTPMIIQQPVSIQPPTTHQHQSIAQKPTNTNQLTIQQASQLNQNINHIQIATAQSSAQKPQQIVVNTGQVNQQLFVQQLANQQLQQRTQGQAQAFVQLQTAQPVSQTQPAQTKTHVNQNALQVSSAEVGNQHVSQQVTANVQQPQSNLHPASQTQQSTQLSTTLIQPSPQQTPQQKINIQIAPSQTVLQQLGQPQTQMTLPTSVTQSTTEPVRIAPLPIVSSHNISTQPVQITQVRQASSVVQTVPVTPADPNSSISVRTVPSGHTQESKVTLIGQHEGGSIAPTKIIQKASIPAGVKLLKNPLQNIDIPAQIQKMQVALEHIMKIANTPENQPKKKKVPTATLR